MRDIFKAFVISDPHVGNHLPHAVAAGNGITDRLEDSLHALDWCFATAQKLDLPLVCLGDLFDEHLVDTVTLKLLAQFLRDKYPRSVMLVVPGNHDASDQSNRHFSPEWLQQFSSNFHVLNDFYPYAVQNEVVNSELVAAMPFCSEKRAREFFAEKAGKERLLLCHLEVNGYGHGGGWICKGALDEEELAPWGAVLSGHFHAQQRFKLTNGMYVGALRQLKFDDAGKPQGGWVVSWDGAKLDMKFIEYAGCKFHQLEMGAPELDQLVEEADLHGADTFESCTYMKVKVFGSDDELKQLDRERVRRAAAEQHIRRVIFDDRMVTSKEKKRLDVDIGAPLEDLMAAYMNHPAVQTHGLDRDVLLHLGIEALRDAQARMHKQAVAVSDEPGQGEE
jgi:DNA repair exonuclease SbcCD nuclease subunit